MGVLVWLLAVAGVTGALTVVIHVSNRKLAAHRHRQVLPAHYSSLLEADPSRHPGYCPTCGADNDPGYRICENCGNEIPTTDDGSRRLDVQYIFNE